MVCALLGSYAGFTFIYLQDWIADRFRFTRVAFNGMIEAIVLGIAISWECAFKKSVHSVADLAGHGRAHVYTGFFICVFLFVAVVPAIVMYMLPMAMKATAAANAANIL